MKSAGSQLLVTPLFAATCALAAGVCGCHRSNDIVPDLIVAVAGDNQADAPETFLEPLVVRVLGPRTIDFLGRTVEREPAPGVAVTFKVEGEDHRRTGEIVSQPVSHPLLYARPESSSGGYVALEVKTDPTGIARVWVKLGSGTGEWSVQAKTAKEKPGKEKPVRFRILSGIKLEYEKEGVVGSKIPITVRMIRLPTEAEASRIPADAVETSDAESRWIPVPNRQIVFRLVGQPPGAEVSDPLKDPSNDTTRYGLRQTDLTLGDKTGVYQVMVDILPPATGESPEERPFRGLVLQIVAIDWLFVSLKLAAGMLVFIIGVRLLGSGCLLLASPYLHLPTGSWARNRLHGYLGGILGGATFQSSSLLNSHLITLANGGLLNAANAVGLLCGAALGGTILPQLLALDISGLTAPFLLIGAVLLVWRRVTSFSSWAWVFLGAGLILTGWDLLSDAVELTALSEKFKTDVLFGDVNPSLPFLVYLVRFLTYFAAGAVVAFFLRTSNLLVVLAILFAADGIILPTTALPLVLGANLGAAAMVLAGALRKRREARRLALAGFLLQFLGCAGAGVLALITVLGQPLLLWVVEWLTPGRLFPLGNNVEQHIAAAHTLYNFFAGAVFLLFPRALLRPTDRLLPPSPGSEEIKPHVLDRQLIAVPALALRQATAEAIYMTELCRKTVAEAFDSFRYNDLELSEQVVRREEMISGMHRDICLFLIEVATNQLSPRDASQLEILQSAGDSLARIGELAERLRDLSSRKIEEQVATSEEVNRDLNETYDLVIAQFGNILSLLRQRDARTEESAVKMLERLAKSSSRVETYWRQRLEQADISGPPVALHLQTVIYQEAFSILFRIANHLAHVAQRMRILTPERF